MVGAKHDVPVEVWNIVWMRFSALEDAFDRCDGVAILTSFVRAYLFDAAGEIA